MGTATDPYQPIEGRYTLTRACLELLDAANTPVGLVTKGPLVVRDADILARMSERGLATVYMSVPTVDAAWEQLEPGTAPPLQRLRAVRRLLDAGVRAGVLMSPLVPGFSTHPSRIEATLAAMAELEVPLLGGNVLYLEDGSRDHFLQFLRGAGAAPARQVRAPLRAEVSRPDVCRAGEGRAGRAACALRREPPPTRGGCAAVNGLAHGSVAQRVHLTSTFTTSNARPSRSVVANGHADVASALRRLRPISAAMRCSVGGWVLNSENSPRTLNGLMMNMCAVAGLASIGTCLL